MKREKLSWFGFKISEKQSVQIFIGSVIGFFFSLYAIISMLFYVIYNLTVWYNLLPIEDQVYLDLFLTWLPFAIIFGTTLFLSLYSMIHCRKIAKTYYEINDSVGSNNLPPKYTKKITKSVLRHCLNCGTEQKGHEKYCVKCGNNLNQLE